MGPRSLTIIVKRHPLTRAEICISMRTGTSSLDCHGILIKQWAFPEVWMDCSLRWSGTDPYPGRVCLPTRSSWRGTDFLSPPISLVNLLSGRNDSVDFRAVEQPFRRLMGPNTLRATYGNSLIWPKPLSGSPDAVALDSMKAIPPICSWVKCGVMADSSAMTT